MRRSPTWWLPLLAAVASGAWTGALLPEHTPATWLLVPFAVLAGGLMPFSPLSAALVLIIGNAAATMLGLAFGEIEFLMPNMAVVFLLARRMLNIWPAVAVVFAFSMTALGRLTAPTFTEVVMVLAFYSSMALFGHLVKRRASDAAQAVAETARLAELDIDEVVHQSTAAEGVRVTTESLLVIRQSVMQMRQLASQASDQLDTAKMADIWAEGEQAINSLHALLSSLHEPKRVEPARRTPRALDLAQRHRALARVTVTVLASVGCVAYAAWHAGPLPALIVLAAISPFGVLLAKPLSLPASGAVAAAYLFAALGPEFVYDALPPVALCLGMMVWQLTAELSWQAWSGIVLVGGSAALLGSHYGTPGLGFIIAMVILSAVASWQWQQKDRVVLAEQVRSARLSAAITAARANAQRTERQRVARELHDGLSYAITAMSLQAQAAVAQVASSPAAARHHLQVVQEVGTTALSEIDSVTASMQRTVNRDDMNVWALLAEAHTRGHTIDFELMDDFPPGTLAYRVIQESLTNVARYAPGAAVSISAGSQDEHWFVRVTNRATEGDIAESGRGMGSGLRGLAQRVLQLGGAFDAGPRADGFEVFARWPMSAPMSPSPW